MDDDRRDLGAVGERVAMAVLERHGVRLEQRNREVGRGEIDAVGVVGGRRVAVEVRTVRGPLRLDLMFPTAKRRQVGRLARSIGVHRVDLVGVAFDAVGVVIHWSRDVPTD